MSYIQDNNKKIRNAFDKASKIAMQRELFSMIALLEYGVNQCLRHHDPDHQNHLNDGDSYGYILLKDGRELKRRIYSGNGDAEANANSALDKVKGYCPTTGWCGVVLAGMLPYEYFKVSHEIRFMYDAMKDIRNLPFDDVFQKMAI